MSSPANLATVQAAMSAGAWQQAIALASRFADLGDERKAILDAHTAYKNPRFLLQLKRDPEALKAAGIEAMQRRYAPRAEPEQLTRKALGIEAGAAPRVMTRRSRTASR